MSEFELIQIIDMQINRLMSNSMNFITLLFAYAAASFLVGKKLSRIIAVTLTFVYSLAEIGPIFGVLIAARGLETSMVHYQSNFPDGLLSPNMEIASNLPIFAVGALPLMMGWLISIFYLHAYVRRHLVADGD